MTALRLPRPIPGSVSLIDRIRFAIRKAFYAPPGACCPRHAAMARGRRIGGGGW